MALELELSAFGSEYVTAEGDLAAESELQAPGPR